MSRQSDDDLTIEPTEASVDARGVPLRPATDARGVDTAPSVLAATSRFTPGAIVAGRYRLVALLGRGGMGEVYRADDLTLDQPVALKFLPEGAARSEAHLAQFHNELRIARQVSHKNVCRLYDLGEADGRRFLTMEYVDGEDLSSSLRRFGRMPPDKAVQIARQLCAGVAAAHEKGVLHRDLKPANVMLDGNGDVRITDFGIATAADDTGAGLAGTPQYMAPELLAGKPSSIRSDVYALGLILFEIFTGKRAFEAKTIGELRELHESQTVTTPSAIVRDLDPAVERIILRCLDKDPDKRPASALTVAAALPGGDPLAAALAAGETPSPDMLSAAAEAEALTPARAMAAVVIVFVGMLTIAGLSAGTSIIGRASPQKEPAVLIDRAEQVLALLGFTDRPADRAYGLVVAEDQIEWLSEKGGPQRWDPLSKGVPPGVLLWYRTSPGPMIPLDSLDPDDPPMTVTNMRSLKLDLRGRLQEFHWVPPQFEKSAEPPREPRWDALFEAAGLRLTDFSQVSPQWTPPHYADARMAWEGTLAADPTIRVRVEGAAYRGQPVSFSIVGPWTRPAGMNIAGFLTGDSSQESSTASGVFNVETVLVLGILLVFLAAMWLARHNVRTNRADRRGAARLVAYLSLSGFAVWITRSHHVAATEAELQSFVQTGGILALISAAMWVVYLALEPYVRRFWPDSLLGWSRLVAGHIRDPRVGRDVLTGAVFGVALAAVGVMRAVVPLRLGYSAPYPNYGAFVDALLGLRWLTAGLIAGSVGALENALFTVLIFVVLRLLLRRVWLSIAVGTAMLSLVSLGNIGDGPIVVPFAVMRGALVAFVVVRFGLLAFAVASYVANALMAMPLTLDVSHWSATASNWTLAGIMLLTLFGFYASRAGQPLFGSVLRD